MSRNGTWMLAILIVVLFAVEAVPAWAQAGDGRLIGTWAQPFSWKGRKLIGIMRLDADLQYRLWVENDPSDPGSSGSFRADRQMLWIRKSNDTRSVARYSFEGGDTLAIQWADCVKKWTRRRDHPRAPGEGTGGRGLSAEDRRDPEKCYGEGVRLYRGENMREATEWFLQAARLGHAAGQLQIGWHYETGIGMSQDFAAAAEWYMKSAAQGNGQAMANLGFNYEIGAGVAEDWVEAARWYAKGAERNNRQAWIRLAVAYRYGVGVPQDRDRTIKCYRNAVALGDKTVDDEIRWLQCPTNNVGYYSEAEHAMLIRGKLPTSARLWGDMGTSGKLFHNSAERMMWAAQLQGRIEADEAEAFAEHNRQVQHLLLGGYSYGDAERLAGW